MSNWIQCKDKILLTPELCFVWLLINWTTAVKTWKRYAKGKLNDWLIWQKLLVITAIQMTFITRKKKKRDK